MNIENKNISNAAGSRRTYLSPCVQIIKMETTNPLAESHEIPIDTPGAIDANGKRWQGDDLDSWDEEDANYENNWGSGW